MVGRLLSDRSGNFSVMLAVLALPVMTAVGLAVDTSNTLRLRSDLQNAADAAALVAARDTHLSEEERIEAARSFFAANEDIAASVLSVRVQLTATGATVTARGKPKTMIMGAFSRKSTLIDVKSVAQNATNSLEVIFALDVSGSMLAGYGGTERRIDVLKRQTTEFVETLKAQTNLDVRVGLVPFTMTVNIGTANQDLVDATDHPLFNGTEWKGCVFERSGANAFLANPPGKWHAYIWPPMPNQVSPSDWGLNPSNGTNSGYASLDEATSSGLGSQVGGPNFNCVRTPIMPLTTDLDAAIDAIGDLEAFPNHGTLISPAVTWGLRLLHPGKPFKDAKPYSPSARKVLVVVTDGDQTTEAEYSGDGVFNSSTNSVDAWKFNPSLFGLYGDVLSSATGPLDNLSPYGFIRDSRPFGKNYADWADVSDALVDLSDKACGEVKSTAQGRNITVYSIGVSTATAPGSRAHTALQNCASKPANHFYAADQDAFEEAMAAIIEDVRRLRLTN